VLTRVEIARLIDHTLLRPDATLREIDNLVVEAVDLEVFAVCVEDRWVDRVVPRAHGAGLRTVIVSGFPTGLEPTVVKAAEASSAVARGADEVDMVANLGALQLGRFDLVERDIADVREAMDKASNGKILKVILETAAFGEEAIIDAALAAERGGADFVKTSTGFHPAGGASLEAVRFLVQAVGGRLGVKASGGIRTSQDALDLLKAGATRLGVSGTRTVLDGWDA